MIVAMKKDALSLIELKGSMNTFDYSSEVQFSRLCQVVPELKNRGILADIYLLQINLDYGLYQILDSRFYGIVFSRINKTAGLKRPIVPIVDDIVKRMKKKGVGLRGIQRPRRPSNRTSAPFR